MHRLGSNYVLDERIGRGAQGEVWRGRHVQSGSGQTTGSGTQEAPLAFKILRADLVEDEGLVDRFIKERSTLTRVHSPYVVGIRDFVIEGTTFAIVMDYVPGGDLRALLKAEGPLAPGEVARIGAHVAEGLAAVHAAGVVHRDVKPANILLDTTTVPTTPRVADFGIARLHNAAGASRLTGILGTPLYMAPEILAGDVPGPTADIYSLGIVLYELCCGITPFVGDPAKLLGQHLNRVPGRPEGIPEQLWQTLMRMLAKQPSNRPSAQQVSRELEGLRHVMEGMDPAPRIDAPPESAPSSESLSFGYNPPNVMAHTATQQGHLSRFPPGSSGDMSNSIHRASVPYPYGPYGGTYGAIPGKHPPRRRRGWKLALASVLVVSLAGAGVWVLRHFFGGADESGSYVAGLPAGKDFSETWRLPDVSKVRVSPDRTMIAVRSSSKWAVYKLNDEDHNSIWEGECYSEESGFWNGSSFLCAHSKKRELISSDGSVSTPPGPADSDLKGSTAENAINIVSGIGDLVAFDKSGKEVWRLYGRYSDALVRDGFILAVEDESDTVQVVSSKTGKKLASDSFVRPYKSLREDPYPAGFGIDVGEKAFYQIKDGEYSIWDGNGEKKNTGKTHATTSNWSTSDPVEPEELADVFDAVPDDSSNVVRGHSKMVEAKIDNAECKFRIGDRSFDVLAPEETSESCNISLIGLTGNDSAILVNSTNDSDKSVTSYKGGGVLAAYSLDDGKMLWNVPGNFGRVIDSKRIAISQGESYSTDIVIGKIKEK